MLKIEADGNLAHNQPQSFFAAFELMGSASTGELAIFSPMGSTLATLTWSPQTTTLRANGETRPFETLDAMLKSATGAEIPVVSLFAWLAGEPRVTPGWLADLSQISSGKLVARRTEPVPTVELRIALDR